MKQRVPDTRRVILACAQCDVLVSRVPSQVSRGRTFCTVGCRRHWQATHGTLFRPKALER